MAQAFAGGSSPAIATYLVDTFGNYSPGIMVSVLALLSMLGLRIAPGETLYSPENTDELFSNYSDDENDSNASHGIESIDKNAREIV